MNEVCAVSHYVAFKALAGNWLGNKINILILPSYCYCQGNVTKTTENIYSAAQDFTQGLFLFITCAGACTLRLVLLAGSNFNEMPPQPSWKDPTH